MSALPFSLSPIWAGGMRIVMPWFIPVALVLGALGTKTGAYQRRMARKNHDPSWWMIVVLAWLPLLYWIIAQYLPPD